jgi:hypothetical protein
MNLGKRLSVLLLSLFAVACFGSASQSAATPTNASSFAREPPSEYTLVDPSDPRARSALAFLAPRPIAPPGSGEPPLPMYGAMVLQRVKNFDAWHEVFDQGRLARMDAGFVAHGIMRGVDNDRMIAVWFAVTDVELAKEFFASGELRAGGIEGKPRVLLWNNVEAKMDPGRKGLSAALVTIKVKDLTAFKLAFDAAASARTAAGIVGYGLSSDVDDPSTAYVYLQSDDPGTLKAYLAAKDTRQSWKDAGQTGSASITLVREGEMTTYQ